MWPCRFRSAGWKVDWPHAVLFKIVLVSAEKAEQLQFYLVACTEEASTLPTIGLILYCSKSPTLVDYTLQNSSVLVWGSEYQFTQAL